MGRIIYFWVFLFVAGFYVDGQKNEGDSCVDEYTNTAGKCTNADQCQTAKVDFQQNGIRPTFCAYSAFGTSVVCCRDGSTILQAATGTTSETRPVWGSSNSKRVCERKCDVYSRAVIQSVDYIPLLPEPETLTHSAAKCEYTGVELIVGGEDAKRGEFPHMAAIGWANTVGGYSFLCGGGLISPRFVLSAGHCLKFEGTTVQDPSPVIVRLGDQNIDSAVDDGADPIDVPIRKAHAHPDYKPPITYNDIVLFELATNVRFNAGVRPACLWTRPDFGSHNKAVATGWGVTNTDQRAPTTSKELQKVSLSLLTNAFCQPLLADFQNRNWVEGFRDSQMCAGELRGGKDTCQGDSGSPLQVTNSDNQCIFYIMGVTSFGRRCAQSGQPAIYTRLSAYLDWVEQTVWPGE